MEKSNEITLKDLIKKEAVYEQFFLDNINTIAEQCSWGKIKRIESQFTIPLKRGKIIADTMIWHEDGSGTCIEIKTSKNNRNDDLTGLSQLLFYGFITEKSLSNLPRLVLVMPKIKSKLYEVINRFNLPINLLELTDDRCVYLPHGVLIGNDYKTT